MLHNNMPEIDDEQFQREFENLMRLDHHNIVRLVGYCYETQHLAMPYKGRTIFAERTYRALCFEYMQNGSLQKHISGMMTLYFLCKYYHVTKMLCLFSLH
jgi:serine/threonine protein kinase